MQLLQKFTSKNIIASLVAFLLLPTAVLPIFAATLEVEPTTILRSQRYATMNWGDLVYQYPTPTNPSNAYGVLLDFNGDHPFNPGQPVIQDAIHTCYSFDTSTLPDNADISSITFSFYPSHIDNSTSQVELFKSVGLDNSVTNCSEQVWLPNRLKPPYIGLDKGSMSLSQLTAYAYNNIPTTISVDKTGFTNIMLAIAAVNTGDTYPIGITEYGNSAVVIDHNNNKPKLIITYDEPVKKPGDANNDNLVNEDDYHLWLTDYQNQTSSPDTDFNNDSSTDGMDYAIWMINYGK